jgi:hypothetical protein
MKMWLIGQVMDAQEGAEGDRDADPADFTTIYLEVDRDIVAVICFASEVPNDVLGQYVRISARLREVHVTIGAPTRLKIFYRADDAVRILDQGLVKRLGLSRHTTVFQSP